jgi:hypothetical protein
MPVTAKPKITVRGYLPSDREVVRRICADTGFLGNPIDPVFEDRELFVDYLSGYYLRVEPDAALVCLVDGEVRGYLMGCRRPLLRQAYHVFSNAWVAVTAIYRCFRRPYGPASRAFLRWVALNGWREVPAAPHRTPHFHINLLADARSMKSTRLLIQSFLELLHRRGHRRVYGQMVTYESRRTRELFERYGFEVMDRVEVTKYRHSFPGRVFLSTVVKDLSAGPALEARPSQEHTDAVG